MPGRIPRVVPDPENVPRMLEEYKKKRDFKLTPEPKAGEDNDASTKIPAEEPLRFVIQKHAARRLHYDFRLELDGVLVSWAVPKGPSLDPSEKRLAVMTEDHPLEYASFEGVISDKQYGAGAVVIWDHGQYSPDEEQIYSWNDRRSAQERMREGLAKGKLSFYLKGTRLEGSWTLVKIRKTEKDWLFIKHNDRFANPDRDLTTQDSSVVSGRTIEDFKLAIKTHPTERLDKQAEPQRAEAQPARRAHFPLVVSPMLAALCTAPFKLSGWFYEPKLDGIRAIAFVRDGKCTLSSRRGNDLSKNYPDLIRVLGGYENDYVFDGEIVALDRAGRPSFQHLQQSSGGLSIFGTGKPNSATIVYYIFDILYADGRDLSNLPQIARKRILESVLKTNDRVRLVKSLGEDGEAAYQACVAHGLEGVMAKKAESVYEAGRRSPNWLKIKASTSAEFLICGYTEGTGARLHTFGSLILGEWDKGKLVYVGGVGTGFDDKKLNFLLAKMKELQSERCPFSKRPPGKLNPTWLKPQLVVEVKYLERTQDNILRFPVFLHLREDIAPTNVKRPEMVEPPALDGSQEKASGLSAKRSESEDVSVTRSKDKIGASENIRELRGSDRIQLSPVERTMKKANDYPADVRNILAQLENDVEKLNLELEANILPLTNLNKIFWPQTAEAPALTKRDYLTYLAKVSPYLLPHLENRVVTLVRFPNGINGGRFYQKHWAKGLPKFVQTVKVFTEHERRDQDFLVCNNLPTLIWLGQIADLELHTSHTRITPQPDAHDLPLTFTGSLEQLERSILNYPDYLVLDLDPYLYSGAEEKGAEPELHKQGFNNCRDAAFFLKKVLDGLKLESFVKTSGRTGLHIYVPIRRSIDYATVRALSEVICRHVLKEHPDEVTMDWAVVKRAGKVFLDHNMNARSKSLASIYSPRVAPEANVSTPLDWEELRHVYPTQFNIRSLPQRLMELGDLWSDILNHKHDIHELISRKSEVTATVASKARRNGKK
jgi:bifunctional non-homologous end joining protein LigD